MRKGAKQRIDGICKLYHIDREGAYKQGKFILETYQDLSWKTAREANYVRDDLMSYCSSDMDRALIYLLTFAVVLVVLFIILGIIVVTITKSLASFNIEDIKLLLLGLADQFSRFWTTIEKTLAAMNINLGRERSTYYRRRKEAVTVFGVAIHEVIRKRKEEADAIRREASQQPMDAVGR